MCWFPGTSSSVLEGAWATWAMCVQEHIRTVQRSCWSCHIDHVVKLSRGLVGPQSCRSTCDILPPLFQCDFPSKRKRCGRVADLEALGPGVIWWPRPWCDKGQSCGIPLSGRASVFVLLPGFDVMDLEQKSIICSGSSETVLFRWEYSSGQIVVKIGILQQRCGPRHLHRWSPSMVLLSGIAGGIWWDLLSRLLFWLHQVWPETELAMWIDETLEEKYWSQFLLKKVWSRKLVLFT